MVLVNFWEIYSSDLKCQHRPLNTVPGQSSRVRNMIFRQSYEGLSVPCISPALSVCDFSSLHSGLDEDHIGSHDASGAGVNLRSTGLLGKIFMSE